jgi:hypothetical protein
VLEHESCPNIETHLLAQRHVLQSDDVQRTLQLLDSALVDQRAVGTPSEELIKQIP